MSTRIAIPVKKLATAKTRLSTILSHEERAHFAASMFRDVLNASKNTPGVDDVIVVTPDDLAASLAHDQDAEVLHENQADGLNRAVQIAIDHALRDGIERLLIVHADIPLLQPSDLSQFVRKRSAIMIAPSRNLDGTNILLLNPPNIIQPRYGWLSFDTHMALARKKEIEPAVIRNERVALDIDTPQGLKTLCGLSPRGFTGEFIREHRLGDRLQAVVKEPPLKPTL